MYQNVPISAVKFKGGEKSASSPDSSSLNTLFTFDLVHREGGESAVAGRELLVLLWIYHGAASVSEFLLNKPVLARYFAYF